MPFDAATSSSIVRRRQIAELCAIERPEVSVLVLQRMLTPQLRDDAERLSRCAGFQMRAVVTPNPRGKQALAARLTEYPYLAADLGVWVEVLADLVECSVVGLRLARLESAMCPRLHVDYVSVRVVSTYTGSATRLVESADVDRSRLGQPGHDESVLRQGAFVHAADSGDIVLLKGERWPGNEGRGAVHRSPAASPTRPRLVLTLDPLWN